MLMKLTPGWLKVDEFDLDGPHGVEGVNAATTAPAASGAADGHTVLEEDVWEPEITVADHGEVVGRLYHLHLNDVEVSGSFVNYWN